jgi:cytochrome d ubiquinol oxidase subunit I
VPDVEAEETKYSVEIPHLASLILTHSYDGKIKGLKSWDREDRPPVLLVFYSFRIMVGIGVLMILTSIVGVYLILKRKLVTTRAYLKWCKLMIPSGFIAVLCGWIVTEVGRQPYVIYGVMRTSKAVSPAIDGLQTAISLGAFFVVYAIIFGAGAMYMINLIKKGPSYVKDEGYFNEHSMAEIKPLLDFWRGK